MGLAQFPHPTAKSPSMIGNFAPTFLFASIMFQVGGRAAGWEEEGGLKREALGAARCEHTCL